MIDSSAITNTGPDLSIPHELRDELTSLHRQLREVQARIAELPLDTGPEPSAPKAMETDAVRDTQDVVDDTDTDDQADVSFAELKKRLANRLRNLDAELKEDNR